MERKASGIVSRHVYAYSPERCAQELAALHAAHPGETELSRIGVSCLGQPIYALKMGNFRANRRVLVQASMHGREWINTQLVMAQMEDYLTQPQYAGLLSDACLVFVPMINPDGVRIAQEGADWIADPDVRALVERLQREGGQPFDQWKSNGRGVDLNRNFDANWNIHYDPREIAGPAYSAYRGPAPESEPETQALLQLTRAFRPTVTLSYHSRGEYVYWFFYQQGDALSRDEALAMRLAALSGYDCTPKERVNVDSCGGYKDWCVQKLGIPAFTIENGADDWGIPVPEGRFDEVYQKAKELTAEAARWDV